MNNKKREISNSKTLSSKFKMYINGENAYKHDTIVMNGIKESLHMDPELFKALKSGKTIYIREAIKGIKENRGSLSELEELVMSISKDILDYGSYSKEDSNYISDELLNFKKDIIEQIKQLHCIKNKNVMEGVFEITDNINDLINSCETTLDKVNELKQFGNNANSNNVDEEIRKKLFHVKNDTLDEFRNVFSRGPILPDSFKKIQIGITKQKHRTKAKRVFATIVGAAVVTTGFAVGGMTLDEKIDRNQIDSTVGYIDELPSKYYNDNSLIFGDKVTKQEKEEVRTKIINNFLSEVMTEKVGISTNVSISKSYSEYNKSDARYVEYENYRTIAQCQVGEERVSSKKEHEANAIETNKGKQETLRRDKDIEKIIDWIDKVDVKELYSMSDEEKNEIFNFLKLDILAADLRTKVIASMSNQKMEIPEELGELNLKNNQDEIELG